MSSGRSESFSKSSTTPKFVTSWMGAAGQEATNALLKQIKTAAPLRWEDYFGLVGQPNEIRDVSDDLFQVGTPQSLKEIENSALATNLAGAENQMRQVRMGNPGMQATSPFVKELEAAASGRGYAAGGEAIRQARQEREQQNAQQGLNATALRLDVDKSRTAQQLQRAQAAASMRGVDAGYLPNLSQALLSFLRPQPFSKSKSYSYDFFEDEPGRSFF